MYNEHVREEVSCQKKYFWQSDCLSNLAILYGLCILDSSFLYYCAGGYLTSIACPFYSHSLPTTDSSKAVVSMLLVKVYSHSTG